MKKLRFLSCVLALSVILSVAFSPSCYAADTQEVDGRLNLSSRYSVTPFNEVWDHSSKLGTTGNFASGSSISVYGDVPQGLYYYGNYNAGMVDGSNLNIKAGSSFSFSITNLIYKLNVKAPNGNTIETVTLKSSDFISVGCRLVYTDSSVEYFWGNQYLLNGMNGVLNYNFSIDKLPKDLARVHFVSYVDIPTIAKNYSTYDPATLTFRLIAQSSSAGVQFTYEESTNSLLGNIIQWLKDIKDAIVNLPELIMEKIKGLFIPTEEDMTAIKDNFDLLMQERFGALYEAGSIISEFVDSFTFQGEKRSIAFPMVEIFLAEDSFVFGGWEVDLIPYGFESIIGVLKGLIGIVCTLLFVVMLRNKFNKIVGDHT